MCHYEKDAAEFSLSLLEKSFLKVYGGNDKQVDLSPAIDIHFLTNWIPETVFFEDVNSKENLWSRLV